MSVSRLASLLVAAAYLVAMALIVPHDAQLMVPCVLATVMPLPFIWFSEAFGNYTGPAHMGYINRTTPGPMVAIAAWIMLLTVPAVLLALSR